MGYPSIKTLRDHWSHDTAVAIRKVLDGRTDPESYDTVDTWVRQCFHRPSGDELKAEALNEILGGFGVEAIRGRYVDHYHQDVQASYINMGDTYDITLLLDHEQDRWQVTSFGNWVEHHSQERKIE